jgi:hypothetical protein
MIEYIKQKGDALVLEKEDCTAEYIYVDELKNAVKLAEMKGLEFVFIASCHS